MIDEFIKDASAFDYDRIVAVGGGAVMDMSKVVAVAGGASIDEVIDHLPDFKRKVRLVLVPTTCGTGSEVTEIAAVNRTRLGCKAGIAGPEMFADDAVLIPELLYGLPDHDLFFGDAADTVIQNAQNAYRTAGMSANESAIRPWSKRVPPVHRNAAPSATS